MGRWWWHSKWSRGASLFGHGGGYEVVVGVIKMVGLLAQLIGQG